MAWLETRSETFTARHASRDAGDAAVVLAQLEAVRVDLERRFEHRVGEMAIVLHGTVAQLDAAQPLLALHRRLTTPAGRRYLVGWAAEDELHVLAPRNLAGRASNVEGSIDFLMLAPASLLARRVVGENNAKLPPPLKPRSVRHYLRWAWLVEGAAQ